MKLRAGPRSRARTKTTSSAISVAVSQARGRSSQRHRMRMGRDLAGDIRKTLQCQTRERSADRRSLRDAPRRAPKGPATLADGSPDPNALDPPVFHNEDLLQR